MKEEVFQTTSTKDNTTTSSEDSLVQKVFNWGLESYESLSFLRFCALGLSLFFADANRQNSKGYTILMYACKYGEEDIVSIILSIRGIDVNVKNQDGETALALAIKNRHLDIALTLLNIEGIDVDFINTLQSYNKNNKNWNVTPLMWAILNQDDYYMRWLLNDFLRNKKVDVNVKDKKGKTALIHAIKTQNTKVILRLLEKGADITDITDCKSTSQDKAIMKMLNKHQIKLLKECKEPLEKALPGIKVDFIQGIVGKYLGFSLPTSLSKNNKLEQKRVPRSTICSQCTIL